MYGCSARLMPWLKRQGLLPKPLVQQLLPNFFVFIIESSIGVQCVVLLIACMLCIEVVGALVVRETRTQSVATCFARCGNARIIMCRAAASSRRRVARDSSGSSYTRIFWSTFASICGSP